LAWRSNTFVAYAKFIVVSFPRRPRPAPLGDRPTSSIMTQDFQPCGGRLVAWRAERIAELRLSIKAADGRAMDCAAAGAAALSGDHRDFTNRSAQDSSDGCT